MQSAFHGFLMLALDQEEYHQEGRSHSSLPAPEFVSEQFRPRL